MTDWQRRTRGGVSRRLTEQAAEWYLAQDEGLSETQRAGFLRWLCGSPEHLAEYLVIARLHGDLRAVAAAEASSTAQLIARAQAEPWVVALPLHRSIVPAVEQVRTAHPRARRLRGLLAAVVFGLALLGGSMAWQRSHEQVRTYAADQAPNTLTLADGSLVQLDRHSAIAVRFTARERQIVLLRGQVLIDVGKDPARPLRVRLGATTLQDIGTVFSASLGAHGSSVTVLSGEVRVLRTPVSAAAVQPARAATAPAAASVAGDALAQLRGGQQAQLDAAGQVIRLASVDLAQATAWLPDTIDFDHRTVAEVARRFNAYTAKPVSIDDPALAAMRISGVFHARDREAFLAYLQTLPGVRVQRDASRIRVVRDLMLGDASGGGDASRRL